MPCSKHRRGQSLRFHILTCTYVDHRSTVSCTCEIFSLCAYKVKSESESEGCSVMANSLQPHGLYTPWNSPGQNTGVGSLSLLQGIFPTQESNQVLLHCRRILHQLNYKVSTFGKVIFHKVLNCFSCVRLLATPWTVVHQSPLSMEFSRQDTRVGCHFLPQGILQIQGSNPQSLTSPALVGGFFTTSATEQWGAQSSKFLTCLKIYDILYSDCDIEICCIPPKKIKEKISFQMQSFSSYTFRTCERRQRINQ